MLLSRPLSASSQSSLYSPGFTWPGKGDRPRTAGEPPNALVEDAAIRGGPLFPSPFPLPLIPWRTQLVPMADANLGRGRFARKCFGVSDRSTHGGLGRVRDTEEDCGTCSGAPSRFPRPPGSIYTVHWKG